MHPQSSLGTQKVYRKPDYNQTQIGFITSAKDYEQYGRVEVVFLDYSNPFPVWATGLDREPVDGDQVLVGFMQGRHDAPYLIGFVRNESYTSNFVKVEKDKITLQIPTDPSDINERLMDDSKKASRITIEISASGIAINSGTAAVARVGDTVQVSVPGVGTCTGTITSGAPNVKA